MSATITPMTTARRNYDDAEGSEGPKRPEATTRTTTARVKPRGLSTLQSLLLAGGSALAAVVAVDWYRKVFKSGGGGDEDGGAKQPQQAAMPASPMQQQTFVPMPMPFPMPMPMYGGGMPSPPARNRGADDDEESERDLLKRMAKDRKKAQLIKEMQRRRIDDLAEEFMDD